MGKISILTKEQEIILDLISKEKYLANNFYFTGGTALSQYYLNHRYSDDLDFFSTNKIEKDIIFTLMNDWADTVRFTIQSRFVEVVYRFDLTFPSGVKLKVDFGYYPYKLVEKGPRLHSMAVDSMRDIATNKITTVNQRTDVKDFVDLYFLLNEQYTVWDLIYSSEVKFKNLDIDIMLLAEDFLKVDEFDILPKMIKPLTLDQLKIFFRKKAIEIGKKAIR